MVLTFWKKLKQHRTLICSIIFLVLYSVSISSAAPLYTTNNTTLDPQCIPGDTDCTVSQLPSQWATGTGAISYNGNVGIGTTNPGAALQITASDDFVYSQMDVYSSTSWHSPFIRNRHAAGTEATPLAVSNNFVTARFGGMGHDGTQFIDNALIRFSIDGTVATNQMPGRMEFYTTSPGAGELTEKMRLTANGRLGIGVTLPGYPLDVAGTINTSGNLSLPVTTSTAGAITVGGNPYIHFYTPSNFVTGIPGSNIFIGQNSGNYTMAGTAGTAAGNYNVAVGYSALNLNTTGTNNVALGYNALAGNTGGSYAVAIGYGALAVGNNAGSSSVAIGWNAMNATTSGGASTAVGTSALQANTTGYYNTAIGYFAGVSVVGGFQNTLIGNSAGSCTTSGSTNTFVGDGAASGNRNSLLACPGFTTGSSNTGVGVSALNLITSGQNNTTVGVSGLLSLTTGSFNVGMGTSALRNLVSGSYNNASGYRSMYLTTGSNNIAIGHQSGYNLSTGNANITIGTFVDPVSTTSDSQLNIGNILYGSGVYNGTSQSSAAITAGKIGIATSTLTYTLNVGNSSVSGIVAGFQNSSGTCTINPTTTSLSCSSDRTLKKDIVALDTDTLNKVLSLQPVTYHWNTESDTDSTHAGFIAQEVEAIFPDLVSTDPNTGLKSLAYTGLIPYTVKAIQDINITITTLADTTKSNSLRDSLIAWLGSTTNGLTALFSKKVTTDELCLKDAAGETCFTRSDINAFLQQQSVQLVVPAPQAQEQEQTQEQQQALEQEPAPEEQVAPVEVITPASEESTPTVSENL